MRRLSGHIYSYTKASEHRVIKQILQARHPNWKIFYDVDDLGYISKQALESHIARSYAFLCFLDDETFDSPWCPDEIRAAVSHGVPIRIIVDHDKFPDVGKLIAHWRHKRPDVAKIVFGSGSYQAILFSWKLTAQGHYQSYRSKAALIMNFRMDRMLL